jgi:hypothetical protein
MYIGIDSSVNVLPSFSDRQRPPHHLPPHFHTLLLPPQVQSQDIAVTFLARLIFNQHQIPNDFLDKPEVVDMLRHVLGHKSTALKLTGVAFITLSPASVYHHLATEFEQAISSLADSPGRTLKIVIWEAGRGIWGLPCSLSGPASKALENSQFLARAAESVPSVLPKCLWPLLPQETQRLVASSQGLVLNGSDGTEEGRGGTAAEGNQDNNATAIDAGVDVMSPKDPQQQQQQQQQGQNILLWPKRVTSVRNSLTSVVPPLMYKQQEQQQHPGMPLTTIVQSQNGTASNAQQTISLLVPPVQGGGLGAPTPIPLTKRRSSEKGSLILSADEYAAVKVEGLREEETSALLASSKRPRRSGSYAHLMGGASMVR